MEKIKQLREITGAGMVDCKKALEESGGDIEKATEILRKKGIAKAAKRGEREANEGLVKVSANEDGTESYILEVNAETDFVARNEKFQHFVDSVMTVIISQKPTDLGTLLSIEIAGGTIKDVQDNLSGTIGEKIGVKRFAILSGKTVSAYSHAGGRIGVLVSLDASGKQELAKNLAMQVAAANPKYLAPENVLAEELEKEKEIYREQLKNEGKPEAIWDKIMAGKINKFYEDFCLLKQEHIMDDKKKVEDVLEGAKIDGFVRYSL